MQFLGSNNFEMLIWSTVIIASLNIVYINTLHRKK